MLTGVFIAATETVNAWQYHTHLDVWIIVAGVVAAYFLALRRFGSGAATKGQVACFLSGMAVLWIASDYPIHDIGEDFLFSVHMAQHLLITLVAPPLLIAGMPDSMMRKIFCGDSIYRFAKFFFRPLVAGIIFNVVTVFAHWPVVVNGALNHHWIHFFVHVLIFSTAFAMWMPVFNRLDELPKLSGPAKLIYLFLMSVLPTVPAAFITFSSTPVYSFYANAPRVIANFNAVDDQQLAGAIMKVIGGGFLWIVIIIEFFRWSASDEKAAKEERDRAGTQSDAVSVR